MANQNIWNGLHNENVAWILVLVRFIEQRFTRVSLVVKYMDPNALYIGMDIVKSFYYTSHMGLQQVVVPRWKAVSSLQHILLAVLQCIAYNLSSHRPTCTSTCPRDFFVARSVNQSIQTLHVSN